MPECPKCERDLEEVEFPFGSDVRCECGALLETDWDYYDDEDSRTWWVVGEKEEE